MKSVSERLIPALTFKKVDFEKEYVDDVEAREDIINREDANVVTSQFKGPWPPKDHHAILLDIDEPAELVPSSTPGHHHLYVSVYCKWEDYVEFIKAGQKIGLLQEGYVKASIERGYTAVRLPEIKKSDIDFSIPPL